MNRHGKIKTGAEILSQLLVSHGVEYCVVSPGSRNAPLVAAIARNSKLKTEIVIDERIAAFVALGVESASKRPVALICTSGTAMLNYAPAVAEAYYRQLPLIVITADRPPEWIDQDDSQTLRQPGALANFVKRSYNLKAESANATQSWWINREINDALLTAVKAPHGPVHINMSIDEPLFDDDDICEVDTNQRVITTITPTPTISTSEARWLATELQAPRKVMIIAGFSDPDERVNRAIAKLARSSNVVVLTESIANVIAKGVINRIDSTLSAISDDELDSLRPDIVITFGGALVSRMIKRFIRECGCDTQHWQVGTRSQTVDCFCHLTRRIEIEPAEFLTALAAVKPMASGESVYRDSWLSAAHRAEHSHNEYISRQPWCDLVAYEQIFRSMPRGWYLHLSNGTSIRYGQLMTDGTQRRVDCNRGVSGIDGCTSTAIGASIVNDGTTLLVSGDTSFQYDIGALAISQLSPKMKIIVVCNGGGAIFHFINSTRNLPETQRYLAVGTNLPLDKLCEAYGIAYFHAADRSELSRALRPFIAERDRCALLAVFTDGLLSAEVLRRYFTRHQS